MAMRRTSQLTKRLTRTKAVMGKILPSTTRVIRRQVQYVGIEQCIYDILGTFSRLIDMPVTMAMLIIIIAVCVTHTDDLSIGFLKDLAEMYPSNRILKFIKDNFLKSLGLAIFMTIVIDLPRNVSKFIIGFAAVVWVLVLPTCNVYQYGVQAFVLHAFFRVRLYRSKMLLLFIALAICLFGHAMLGDWEHPYVNPNATQQTPTVARTSSGRYVDSQPGQQGLGSKIHSVK